MSTVNPEQLKALLARLDDASRKILSTRGYTSDAKTLKIIEELLREQDAHTRHPTRPIR